MSDATKPEPQCSFCHKNSADVRHLIAGRDDVIICNECFGISRKIVLSKDDPVALANLRIAAFTALKGWGSVGDDGVWKTWDWPALCLRAERLVEWSLQSIDGIPKTEQA